VISFYKKYRKSPHRIGLTICIIVGAILIVLAWMQFNGELFIDSRFSDKRIIGRTANEIIQMDGPPVADSRQHGDPDDSNNFKLIYFSGFQNILIRFEHGKAVEVTHSAK